MTEKSTFARRVRAAKPRATKYEVRDDVVSGLALAVQPTGVRPCFLARMVRGRRRYATVGSADAMTIPEARREARRLIASYIEPAKTDNGPRTPGHPMDAFAE
ncbi:MAG: Arm DNA-binding domain-containing protein, partial [Alphaproteobacteria bacterium]|nr:Arm DNA-binding domain-containing protein [Alphaproteobacteria bacterium]